MHRGGAIAASNDPVTGAEAVAAARAFSGGPRGRASLQSLGQAINGCRRARCSCRPHREV
eukprot:8015679-Lingulodinium_polyedra.AAC.1